MKNDLRSLASVVAAIVLLVTVQTSFGVTERIPLIERWSVTRTVSFLMFTLQYATDDVEIGLMVLRSDGHVIAKCWDWKWESSLARIFPDLGTELCALELDDGAWILGKNSTPLIVETFYPDQHGLKVDTETKLSVRSGLFLYGGIPTKVRLTIIGEDDRRKARIFSVEERPTP